MFEVLEIYTKSVSAFIKESLSHGQKEIKKADIQDLLKECPKALHTTVIQQALVNFKDDWCMKRETDKFIFWGSL